MFITLSNQLITATISLKGAELRSLANVSNKRNYIWEVNPAYWESQSPILFPIVGSLKNNSYAYNGKKFELQRHGFARNEDFKVLYQTEKEVLFSLKATEQTLEVYPFYFELQIKYVIRNTTLDVAYKVTNHTESTMPFSIGGHPGFALPQPFTAYSLEFEKEEVLEVYQLKNHLLSDYTFKLPLTNKILPLEYSLFEKDALIFKKIASKQISLLENSIPILKFKFADFPNLGIWTKNNAPYICLEPWFGYADTEICSGNLMEKEGVILLGSKSDFNCSFVIEIL